VPKILVADDNANIQKMVVLAFEERGIEVVAVGNGEAAVRRIPDAQPDLVLADIFMPVRNGYEVCEFVKKDDRFSHVPVILLVGAFDPLDEKEARRVGADGVLKKPFVPPDPLIAMVMSALEKNPKVAAEMAKAKQAKEVLPPEPMERVEMPARPEPKPLPDFPEPTAEEAAQIYAFGKGVRAMDDEPVEATNGPKPPVAEPQETDEDKFDSTSTSHDWRRNAMDFEVPADAANKPAFSSDEILEPPTFPSEREFPPRRVRASEPKVDVAESIVQEVVKPVAPKRVEEPAPAVEEPVAAVPESSEPEPFTKPSPAPEPVVSAEIEPEVDYPEPSSVVAELHSDPVAPPAVRHWMDGLAPTPSAAPERGWVDSLSPATAEPEVHVDAHVDAHVDSPVDSHADAIADPADEPAESYEQSSSPVEEIEEVQAIEAHAETAAAPEHLEPSEQPAWDSAPQFAEEEIVEEPPASAPAESWFAPTPSVFESDSDPVSHPVAVAASQPDEALELDSADTEPSVALRDPGLMESPAVHVSPEPLLVSEDEPHGPSEYGEHPEKISPLHSFFAPASGDPVVEEEPVAAHHSTDNGASAPSFEPFSQPSDSGERIPTGPPPNREALAGIPFLMPPPDFHKSVPEPAASSEDVDDAVRKVLEKLEPRLHDLLSQNVLKPLIENLLQSELAKKEK
jgi:CheY-like chemotaxis protein